MIDAGIASSGEDGKQKSRAKRVRIKWISQGEADEGAFMR